MPESVKMRQTVPRAFRYSIPAWVLLVILGLLCLLMTGCPHQWQRPHPDQNRLISRIGQYYDAIQAHAYTKAQLFYADPRPQVPTKSSSLASKLSLKLASYEIQSLRIDDMDARVVMYITVAGQEHQYDIVIIDHWQYIRDSWFVVDTDQPPADGAIKTLDQKMWQGGIKW